MIRKWLFIGLAAVAASGCVGGGCQGDLAYQKAGTTQPLKAPPGLQVPTPDSNYVIPQVRGKNSDQTYNYTVPDPDNPKKEVSRCLAMPPSMPHNNGGSLPTTAPPPKI